MNSFVNKVLSQREMFWFYFVAVSLFVFPVINVDYLFLDDNARTLLLGDALWRQQGRVLIQLFYNVLSFTFVTPNVFPLAHFVALPVVALALRELAKNFYGRCTMSDCLVVLPLFYSPAYLGMFIYQYDGPAVMLGVAAIIFSVTYPDGGRGGKVLGPALMITVALSMYQVLLNVLLGLYCVEVLRSATHGGAFQNVTKILLRRGAQLGVGLLIYYFTAGRFLKTDRATLLPYDDDWLETVLARFGVVCGKLELFINSGNRWLFIALLLSASLGYMLSGVGLLRRDETYLRKAALLGLYLVAPLLLGLVIPGFTVLFLHFTPNAKLLLGLAPALVGVLFFSREFLRAVDVRAVWVLAIPMMCMLSFSFLYGRFLMAQKELESSTLYALAYDINAHSELRGVDHIYLVDSESPRLWLPAAFDTAQEVPALRYVGGWGDVDLNYLVLVEHFPRVGITNVKGMSAEVFKSITGQQRLVNNRFYDIYLSGRNGYIRLKPIMGPEGHQDRW